MSTTLYLPLRSTKPFSRAHVVDGRFEPLHGPFCRHNPVGHPAEQIIHKADTIQASLIVMGKRGLRFLGVSLFAAKVQPVTISFYLRSKRRERKHSGDL